MDLSKQHSAASVPVATPVVVRFDGACPMCVMLASYAERRLNPEYPMIFLPADVDTKGSELSIELGAGRETLSGEHAWLWLLERHPALGELNWLAQKIGVSGQVSRGLNKTGEFLRRFCFRCR